MFGGESGKLVVRPKRTWRDFVVTVICFQVASEMEVEGCVNGPRNCLWILASTKSVWFEVEGRGKIDALLCLIELLHVCVFRELLYT